MAVPLLQVYEDSDTITLAPQESVNVTFNSWLAAPQDTYLMKAFSAILDDGPTNDTASAQLVVRRPRHDVGASAILAPADTVDSGAVIVPRAAIRNFGGARESFRIRFTIGSFFATETVMVLTVGSTLARGSPGNGSGRPSPGLSIKATERIDPSALRRDRRASQRFRIGDS